MNKINLEIGENYKVQLYPGDKVEEAVYKKFENNRHFFENKKYTISVSDHWLNEEEGLITHLPFSSESIFVHKKTSFLNEANEELK